MTRKRKIMSEDDGQQYDEIFRLLYDESCKESSADDAVMSDGAFRTFERRTGLSRRPFFRSTGLYRSAAVAAVLSLPLAIICMIVLLSGPSDSSVMAVNEVFTGMKEFKKTVLPDGTVVNLDPCSRLVYPSEFKGDERKVYLSGGAFFDVATDSLKRFIVSAQSTEVAVYGTSFHLSSRNDRPDEEVALVEGSVELKSKDSRSATMVSPGQIVRYDKFSGSVIVEEFDVQSYMSVVNSGGIQFLNQTLSEIARELGRIFATNIQIVGDEIQNERYYATFVNGEDLDTILNSLNINGLFTVLHNPNTNTIKLTEK